MNLPVPVRYWSFVRTDLNQALDKISDAQLDFSPKEGLWTIKQTALHIASAEQGWFRFIIQNELDDWPQDLEVGDFPNIDAVKNTLSEIHAQTMDYLAAIDEAELQRVIEAPWGSTFPVHWAIWHVLEHEIHHRGEIFLMLGLLGLEAPDI